MPYCAKNGIGFTVWSPLCQGLLTGKYNEGAPDGSRGKTTKWLENDMTESNLNKVRVLGGLADELGISLAQLSIAWILSHKQISCAIIGATTVAQLKDNLGASGITLSDDTIAKIEDIIS
jgi:aryl-alcohol dehydrogenase-like predicted oxidoreductase